MIAVDVAEHGGLDQHAAIEAIIFDLIDPDDSVLHDAHLIPGIIFGQTCKDSSA